MQLFPYQVSNRDVEFVRSRSRQIMRELGLLSLQPGISVPLAQCHAMIEIDANGTLTVQQLADILCIDKSTASRVIEELKNKNFISVAPNKSDKRSKQITLTKLGKRSLDKINLDSNIQVGQALMLLTPAEQVSVHHGLGNYAKALKRSRLLDSVDVRPIEKQDNPHVTSLIRTVMPEFGAIGPGYAINDTEVENMFSAYKGPSDRRYLVAVQNGKIIGGGGIAPLEGGPEGVCELRKMYLLPVARGMGLGNMILQTLLQFARSAKYEKCYLETLESMAAARKLYEKFEFKRIQKPMGNTGHFGCNIWYLKDLY